MLVSRGGMASMLDTVWLVITALAFGGVVEKAGVLERLIAPVLAAAKSVGALVASLVGAVFATNVVTADQYIAIVLPGRMFKGAFEQRGSRRWCCRAPLERSGTPTSALIPWNSCGAYMARDSGCVDAELSALCGFQLREPAADDRTWPTLGCECCATPGAPKAAPGGGRMPTRA